VDSSQRSELVWGGYKDPIVRAGSLWYRSGFETYTPRKYCFGVVRGKVETPFALCTEPRSSKAGEILGAVNRQGLWGICSIISGDQKSRRFWGRLLKTLVREKWFARPSTEIIYKKGGGAGAK